MTQDCRRMSSGGGRRRRRTSRGRQGLPWICCRCGTETQAPLVWRRRGRSEWMDERWRKEEGSGRLRCCANIRCIKTHAIDFRPVTSGHPPNRGVMIDRGETGFRSSFSQWRAPTQLTLSALQTCRVQQTCCSSLGVCWQGRGDRYDFRGRVSASGQRMHWQQPWQLSCRLDVRSLGSSPPHPCQQCLQVMFGPWMLPARGPRRSQ